MEGKCINENDQCEDKEYTGDMCITPCKDVTNLKCKECGRDEKCTKCEPPFSKEDCSEKWEKCPNGECYINGICIDETSDCENPGYKGPSCETPCNDGKENCEKCHRNGEYISDDEIIETQEDEIDKSTEEINICLSLINFGSLENSDNNISLNINITEDINTKCKDFYKTNKIFEGKNSYSFSIGPSNTNIKADGSSSKTEIYANSTFSTINLGKCEEILKEKNSIDEDKDLIILISEKLIDNATERNTQFEVYNPDTFEKLNLSVCEDEPITISTPIELTDGLKEIKEAYEELKQLGYDIFDKNDKFYTDICAPYTTSDKTDIPLNDRFKEFYLNSETKCTSGCEFDGYNFETNSLNCKCNVMTSDVDLSKLKRGQDEGKEALYKSF